MTDPVVPGAAPPALVDDTTALASLIDANEQLIAVKDIDASIYVHVNDPMSRLLGRAPAQAIGLNDVDVFELDSVSALRVAELAAVAAKCPSRSEHRLLLSGKRRDFVVWRTSLPEVKGRGRLQLSLWTETTQARRKGAATAGRPDADRRAAAGPPATARCAVRPGTARRHDRPLWARPFPRPASPRTRPVDAGASRIRPRLDRRRPARRALASGR